MGTVIIREYADATRDRHGNGLEFLPGVLATDESATSIQTLTTVAGTAQSVTIAANCYFIEIESTADLRIAVRPRRSSTAVTATANHPLIKAGVVTRVKVHQGATLSVLQVGSGYETVAASQTAQVLGSTGAVGDYISHVLVIPATTSPGNVLLLDNATSITIFTGGTVADLTPFVIQLDMTSVSGAWKLTTGANVSAVAVGRFT